MVKMLLMKFYQNTFPSKKMYKVIKPLMLIALGGFIYSAIEILYRGYTHWTMVLVGGISFYLIGLVNEYTQYDFSIIKQMTIGTLIVSTLEFTAGIIVNIILKWNVWDYSNMPFNILGQICLPFSVIWFLLSFFAIVLDDICRYFIFKEDYPHYKIF